MGGDLREGSVGYPSIQVFSPPTPRKLFLSLVVDLQLTPQSKTDIKINLKERHIIEPPGCFPPSPQQTLRYEHYLALVCHCYCRVVHENWPSWSTFKNMVYVIYASSQQNRFIYILEQNICNLLQLNFCSSQLSNKYFKIIIPF